MQIKKKSFLWQKISLKKKQSSMHKNERFVLLMEKTEEISHDESTSAYKYHIIGRS